MHCHRFYGWSAEVTMLLVNTVYQFYSSIENVGVNSGILSMTTFRHFVIEVTNFR